MCNLVKKQRDIQSNIQDIYNNIKILNIGTGYSKTEEITNYGLLNWGINISNVLMNGKYWYFLSQELHNQKG